MRGKPYPCIRERRGQRITPADAGKTICRTKSGLFDADHPRGCGENKQSQLN